RGPAAELLDEPIVASAGADRALRAEPVRDPLEDRARVVIEPAHEPRVDLVLDPGVLEQPPQPLEVLARPLVEVLGDDRRVPDEFLHLGVLAVEDAQRIALEPAAAVLVEPVVMRREIADEDLLVARARFRRADRVDEQLRSPNAERPPQPCRQDDQLGVDLLLLEAERLDGELVELAVPALLRFLAPEHRAARPELL